VEPCSVEKQALRMIDEFFWKIASFNKLENFSDIFVFDYSKQATKEK
jgi:hypothetical protein